MSKRQQAARIAEPDFTTGAFCVKRLRQAPAGLADALADLEARRPSGTIPLVVAGDLVVLYLADFLRPAEARNGGN